MMDLKEYELLKFRLAEVIRAADLAEAKGDKGADERWRPLLGRLAEDRFNVVVAGRFSQGKSTLMNALLGVDRLPTGLVPITSVLTTVRYGSSERVRLEYDQGRLPAEVPLRDLPMYVTEDGNPGNERGIRMAEIQVRAEILRRGVCFVDTPGLGSAIQGNTQTTQRFVPEIDVLVLVTSFESPMTGDEAKFLREAAASGREVFVVLNKQDLVTPDARREVLDYAGRVVHDALGPTAREPYSVSARDGLAAKLSADRDALAASGIDGLETDLIAFLTSSKSELFLAAMCGRVLAALAKSSAAGVEELAGEVATLQQSVLGAPDDDAAAAGAAEMPVDAAAGKPEECGPAGPCELCTAVSSRVFDFLRHYQYAISTQREARKRHADCVGFCPLHTWHYEQIASPRGVCTAYPDLLYGVAGRLHAMADGRAAAGRGCIPVLGGQCPACEVRQATEERGVSAIIARADRTAALGQMPSMDLCLPHLEMVLRSTGNRDTRRNLLLREAALLERTAEDMQRYAIRHDGLKRSLISREEREAPVRALRMLVGDKQVNAPYTIEEIL